MFFFYGAWDYVIFMAIGDSNLNGCENCDNTYLDRYNGAWQTIQVYYLGC